MPTGYRFLPSPILINESAGANHLELALFSNHNACFRDALTGTWLRRGLSISSQHTLFPCTPKASVPIQPSPFIPYSQYHNTSVLRKGPYRGSYVHCTRSSGSTIRVNTNSICNALNWSGKATFWIGLVTKSLCNPVLSPYSPLAAKCCYKNRCLVSALSLLLQPFSSSHHILQTRKVILY